MTPSHASMPLAELERVLCRELGCVVIADERGAPVAVPLVCLRCGRWSR